MSARIAHIYSPSYRAVCTLMSNENDSVTFLAQHRTDDFDAPFALKNEKALCCKTQAVLSHGTLMTDLRV